MNMSDTKNEDKKMVIIVVGAPLAGWLLNTSDPKGHPTQHSLIKNSLIMDTGLSVDNICASGGRHTSGITYLAILQWRHSYKKIYITDEGFLVFGIHTDLHTDKQIA